MRAWMKAMLTAALVALSGTAGGQTLYSFLPYLPDDNGWEILIRHGAAEVPSTLNLFLVNGAGEIAGRYETTVPATHARQVNRTLLRRAGVTAGPWWALIEWSGYATPPRVFLRSTDGFIVPVGSVLERLTAAYMASLHALLPELARYRWGMSGATLQPGRNTEKVGVLRLANISVRDSSDVLLILYDDTGAFSVAALDRLDPGVLVSLRSSEIEARITQGARNPAGKWRVMVLSTGLIEGQVGIWSRGTQLYAPSTVAEPLVVEAPAEGQARGAAIGHGWTADPVHSRLDAAHRAAVSARAGSLRVDRQSAQSLVPDAMLEALRGHFD